jgi:hypothetical protein
MTIIPIVPFEEMTADDQRAHIESVLSEAGLDSEALGLLGFVKPKRRARKDGRMTNGQYVTARWASERIGRSEDAIREEFGKETTGVIKKTYSGRNRRTIRTLLISKNCLKKHYPDVEF